MNLSKIGLLIQALHQATDRKLKTIFLVSGIFPGKVVSVIFLGFECSINPQNFMKIVGAIFDKMKYFFLCELPLILKVDRKRKKNKLQIVARGLDIEFERDWSFGLCATLGDEQKFKNYFSSFRDFSGKSRQCHIVGLRMYYKPTKFNQNCQSHFLEIRNF